VRSLLQEFKGPSTDLFTFFEHIFAPRICPGASLMTAIPVPSDGKTTDGLRLQESQLRNLPQRGANNSKEMQDYGRFLRSLRFFAAIPDYC
jgi:hypothetical protein